MRPRMRSMAMAALLAVGAMLLLALPAHAKGEHESASGMVVLTGPGLDRPIEIKGRLGSFGAGVPDDFAELFAGSGLMPYEASQGWFDLEQDPAALGPTYVVTYTFVGPEMTGSIVQDLYPYADGGRPWFLTRPNQYHPMFGSRTVPSAWWTAPPTVLALLVRNGLPASPPKIAPAPPAPAPPNPLPSPGFQPWIAGVAFAGLLGLLLAGMAAGRRRATLSR